METDSVVKSNEKGSSKRKRRRENEEMQSDKIKIGSDLSRKKRRISKYRSNSRAMIYISRIPHGFYEDEMTSYFSQFGKVLAVFVGRSKKTGKSRGFGFVEFANEEVAKIAAETMNNYLMYNKVIKCEYIPPEKSKKKCLKSTITPQDYPKKRNRKIDTAQKLQAVKKLTKTSYREKAKRKINRFKQMIEESGQKQKKIRAGKTTS